MSLRARLTAGSVGLLVLALGACCALLISSSRAAMLEDAVSYAVLEARQLSTGMLTGNYPAGGEGSDLVDYAALRYAIAQLDRRAAVGSEYVLQSGEEIIYNNSGVDAALALRRSGGDRSGETACAVLSLESGDYCVAGTVLELMGRECTLAVVRDITGSMDQVRTLTLRCVLICAGVTLLAALLTALFLARTLRPLRTLQREARAVAGGDYASRIQLRRRDEVGMLAQDFNTMAASVQRHVQAVETTSQERNMLLHALAHEMRTPVTAITGYAYALGHARMDRAQQREAIEFIDAESRRLERLSDKLAQLVGVEDRPIRRETLPLPELERRLSLVLRPQAQQAGIGLTLDFDAFGSVSGDGDLLMMLVTNLFDNARKAGAAQVTVAFRGGVLSVEDDGRGIGPEQLDKIMQPFYQGDPSRSQEGFGLGLSLCQKIAALHGTELEVESAPGVGSRFRLSFYNSFTPS